MKAHYLLLDALRGVAALCVICYHFGEAFATSPLDQGFNHGYLAVDFFFVLSGFVIGYAYDERLRAGRLSCWGFVCKRLVRLQPMMVMGAVLGLITYCIGGCLRWDGSHVEALPIAGAFLLNLLMLPLLPGSALDVRGNNEGYPLNGPSWSLFFEYLGSLLFVLAVRRLSVKALRAWVLALGLCLAAYSLFKVSGFHNIGVGWSMTLLGFAGGLLRVAFSMSLGLLVFRTFRPLKLRGAFWWCAAVLVVLLGMPYVGVGSALWLNSVYELLLLGGVFPLVVVLGASVQPREGGESRLCTLLGNLSYPLYAVHYPFMYLFYAWVWDNGLGFWETVWVMPLLVVGVVVLAYVAWRFYDVPVRRRLARRQESSGK